MKGSLNSTNYLKPYGFFNKIKLFFKNHHTADIQVQYNIYGIRVFDLHIDFTYTGRAFYRYDGVTYETFSIYDVLNFLEKKGDTIVCITLEDKFKSHKKEVRFKEYCKVIEKLYPNIKFFGGNRAHDMKSLYKFKNFFNSKKIDWYSKLK